MPTHPRPAIVLNLMILILLLAIFAGCQFNYAGQAVIRGGTTWLSCSDSDKGINYESFGIVAYSYLNKSKAFKSEYRDTCNGDSLSEGYCVGRELRIIDHQCETACDSGVCISYTCSDSDGGDEPYEAGATKGRFGLVSDFCRTDQAWQVAGCGQDEPGCRVHEYSCGSYNYATRDFIEPYEHPCPTGCKDGECIELIHLDSHDYQAGEDISITLNPPKYGMASEVGVCPWYLFDTSNMICKGVPLTLLPVCEEQKCFYSTNLTFSIPMEWTTQRYYLFSFYYIQDGSTRQASSLLNVTNPVIQIDQGICHPISLAGDPNLKFDLVFIAENFTDLAPFNDSISSFIGESLFGIDIILNNSGKINFWKLDRYGPLQPPFASDQYPGPAFWEGMVSACGGSDMVVVVDRTIHESPVAFGGDSIPWILVSDSSSQYPSILAHEFGHAFGSLSDEYTRSNIYLPPASIDYTRANIDFMGCPKWCSGQPNTELVLSNGFGCWEGWLEFTACVEMLNLTTDIDPHIEECWNNISDLHNGWFADPTQCDFGTGCIPGTGCFWNAKATNTFRSTDNSIMRSAPPSVGYGPISSQVIISRFNQYR